MNKKRIIGQGVVIAMVVIVCASGTGLAQSKRSIRSVDFRNFSYDNVNGQPVVLRRGRNMTRGEISAGEYGSTLEELKYVDFDADGNEEAFVVIGTTQEAAGTFWAADVFVFAYRSGRPLKLFHESRYKPTGIKLIGKSIVISAYFWRDQDAHCCPYAVETSTYRWQKDGFARVSRNLKRMPKP